MVKLYLLRLAQAAALPFISILEIYCSFNNVQKGQVSSLKNKLQKG